MKRPIASIPVNSVPVRDALVLGGFAFVVCCVLWITQQFTVSAIEQNRQQAFKQTLSAVLPATYDNDPITDSIIISGQQTVQTVYRAYRQTQPVAAAISTFAPDGYSGRIDLLIGISYDGELTGVRVLSHRETPGLGDKIEVAKSPWIVEFDGKSLGSNIVWSVKKDSGDFDQFTGATITPRAVVNSVKRTLDWFSDNRGEIFEQ